MLSLILFVFMIGFMLAFFAIALLSVNGSVSPDAMTFSGVALLAIMTVGFLVITRVYRKRKKRHLSESFPRRDDQRVIVLRRVTEVRQIPRFGDRFQERVVSVGS